MFLATRCPQCGTAFKLVRDQLLLRQGWVRCGRCGEAFDAVEQQFDHRPKPHTVLVASTAMAAASTEHAMLRAQSEEDGQTHFPGAALSPVHAAQALPTETIVASDVAPDVPEAAPEPAPSPTRSTTPELASSTPLPSLHGGYRAAMAAALPSHAPATQDDRPAAAVPADSPWQSGTFSYALPAMPALLPANRHETSTNRAEPPEREHLAEEAVDTLIPMDAEDDAENSAANILAFEADAPGVADLQGEMHSSVQHALESPASSTNGASVAQAMVTDLHADPHAALEDSGLAMFSAEAEAALLQAGPAAQIAQSAQTAGRTEPPAELLRAAEAEAQQLQADFGPMPDDRSMLVEPALAPPPLVVAGDIPSLNPATAHAATVTDTEEDSHFDLGDALHYAFGPDTGIEPPVDAMTQAPRLHADAGQANRHANAGHVVAEASDASDAAIEPRFLRQARAQERWRQPGTRAALGVLAALLIALGSVQAAWTWRDDWASAWPQIRPALTQLCKLSGCTLAAPRKLQSLVLDTSSMAPASNGMLQLNASLRNRGDAVVAYPALELTLTGAQDQIVVRKVIQPAQYLAMGQLAHDASALQRQVQRGLAANAELRIQLQLQLRKDQASGYTLAVFYP